MSRFSLGEVVDPSEDEVKIGRQSTFFTAASMSALPRFSYFTIPRAGTWSLKPLIHRVGAMELFGGIITGQL